MSTCPICQKHADAGRRTGQPIYEDSEMYVAHFPVPEGGTAYRGHLIIEPRRHITRPSELTESEAKSVGYLYQKMSALLEEALDAEHVYLFRIGDMVAHVHFHVVPRYAGAPRDQWGWKLVDWADGPRVGREEVNALSTLLRDKLVNP